MSERNDASETTHRAQRLRRRCAAACAVVLLCMFGLNLLANVGRAPLHGDTYAALEENGSSVGWVVSAKTGVIDGRRGPLYPYFLSAVSTVSGADLGVGLPPVGRTSAGPIVGVHLAVQLVQLSFAAAAAYFAAVVFVGERVGRTRIAALTTFVVLDPTLVHAQLALLPDGLCTSACLVALATWALWLRAASGRALAVFVAAVAMSALLRPEKALVFTAAAGLVTLVVLVRPTWRHLVRRSAAVLVACSAVALASQFVSREVNTLAGRDTWTMRELIVHARLAHPHLTDLREHLPEELAVRFPPVAAEFYDRGIAEARRLVNHVCAGDAQERRRVTDEFARAALEHLAGPLALDIMFDGTTYLVPVLRNAAHVRHYANAGANASALRSSDSWNSWRVATQRSPRITQAAFFAQWLLLVPFALVLVALPFAFALRALLLRVVAHSRGCARPPRARAFDIGTSVPLAAFVLVNSFVFAATQDLFVMRYALVQHALLVGAAAFVLTAAFDRRSRVVRAVP